MAKSGRVYNKAMLSFLTEHYPSNMIAELTVMFNKKFNKKKTPEQIKSCLTNHGIKAGVRRTKSTTKYTSQHIDFLRKRYIDLNQPRLCKLFNETFGFNINTKALSSLLKRHKIKSGRTGQFEAGQESWNKGKKGLMTGGDAGWFKPGHMPINHRTLHSERINKDGYIEMKIAEPNVWKLKHRVVYEKQKGQIPDDKILHFLDGNKTNCAVENLILISRSQGVVMNKLGLSTVPKEIKKTAIALVDVVILTNQRKRA
jgi:hypothetical protein